MGSQNAAPQSPAGYILPPAIVVDRIAIVAVEAAWPTTVSCSAGVIRATGRPREWAMIEIKGHGGFIESIPLTGGQPARR